MRLVLLGLPPSTNNLYTVVRGRQVLSAEGRAFHRALRHVAIEKWGEHPQPGPFALSITYHLRHDRDVEGSHKAAVDALSGVAWRDDLQLVLLSLTKRRLPSGTLPYLSIVVRRLLARPMFRTPGLPIGAHEFRTEMIPPSTNNLYAVVGHSRRLTRLGRATKDGYAFGFKQLGFGPPIETNLRLRMRYGFSADRRDVDGSHKGLLDAARGILWSDDRQFTRLTLSKGRVKPGERAVIVAQYWALAEAATEMAA